MRTQAEICNHDWFGDLPEGWEMKPLKNLFSFSKGLSITKNDLTEAGKSVISYGQIHSKNYFGTGIVNDIIRHVSDAIGKNNNSALVNTGGFVFADTSEDLAGVGNCAYNDLEKTIYGGYHTIVLNPRYESDNKYLAYQFRTDAWRLQLRRQLVDVKLFSGELSLQVQSLRKE
jgi:type I restriction enzyme S subunit